MPSNILSPSNNVLVVPAGLAWPEYQQYHAYISVVVSRFSDFGVINNAEPLVGAAAL
jgi:hypothetical protein